MAGLPFGLPSPGGQGSITGAETLSYTSGLTGVSITFGDNHLPNVLYKGLVGGGLPPLDHFAVDTAYQPGAVFVRTKKKTSVLKVYLVVQGDPTATDQRLSLFQTVDNILSVMEPSTLTAGTLTKTTSDGVSRVLKNVQYVGGFEIDDQAQNLARITLELDFEAFDPTWYSQAIHSTALGSSNDVFGWSVPMGVPLTINGQAQATFNCPNAGNINSKPVFTFTGPLQNYSITNGTNNQSFAISLPLNSGDTLTVDCNLGAVTYTPAGGSPTPYYSAFAGAQQFVQLQPGTNNITFRRDVAGNNQCTVTYQDTWNHG